MSFLSKMSEGLLKKGTPRSLLGDATTIGLKGVGGVLEYNMYKDDEGGGFALAMGIGSLLPWIGEAIMVAEITKAGLSYGTHKKEEMQSQYKANLGTEMADPVGNLSTMRQRSKMNAMIDRSQLGSEAKRYHL